MAAASENLATPQQLFQAGQQTFPIPAGGQPFQASPANPESLRLLAISARKDKRYDDSDACLAKAIQMAPNDALSWFERGTTAFAAGWLEKAAEFFRRAAQLKPDCGEAHLNVGGVLERMERQPEAFDSARRAVELLPDNPTAYFNLGNIHRALGHIGSAIDCYVRAMNLEPDNPRNHWNQAICFLLQGDFQQGWEKYKWRERAGGVYIDRYLQPLWDGSPLAGKSLLIHAEQGVGDEISFASCYPELIEQGAHLVLVCEPRLEKLFRRSFPSAKVYGHRRRSTWEPLDVSDPVDWQIPVGSLAFYLRPSRESFPRQQQYLVADPTQVTAWRERFATLGAGLKIGISWRAGGRPSERRRRTTELDHWQSLFALSGIDWINLQYGEADEEIAEARDRFGITIHDEPEGDPLIDLDGFAAKLAALDLVISVGNTTTHMAGALGIPAWVLLPLVPAWRWMTAGHQSPWYASLQLFRQPKLGDWQTPFQNVLDNLKAHLSERGIDWNAKVPRPKGATTRLGGTAVYRRCTPTEHEQLDQALDDVVLGEVAIPKVLGEAMEQHRLGNYVQAEATYRQILRRAPCHPDALHLLGVVAHQTGRAQLAIQSIGRALALVDSQPVMHFSYGNALNEAGRSEEALVSYRRALELMPTLDEARFHLGATLQKIGRPLEAIEHFQLLAAAAPSSAPAQWNLGNALQLAYQPDEALECFRSAIAIEPGFVKAYKSAAIVLMADGRLEDALEFGRQFVAIEPTQADAHHILACILVAMEHAPEALASFERALELDPQRFDACLNRAHLLTTLGRHVEAEAAYRRALKIKPDDAQAQDALGSSLKEQGRFSEALASYELALHDDSKCGSAHCNAALLHLMMENYPRGWDEYEWRWHSPGGPRPRNYFTQPLWNGHSLADQTILVHNEQGLGDEILFATCFPDLIAQAGHCVLACDHRLAPLLARSMPQATVLGMTRGREHTFRLPAKLHVDVQIPAGSLPRYLRRDAASFRQNARLLTADPTRVQFWRARLAALGPGLKIGISWRAGTTARDRRTRWTHLADWQEMLTLPGTHFVNLQYGDCQQELTELEHTHGMHLHAWPDCDPRQNIDDLAAQIAALDLVISVGNANVHLAGALGVPTWSFIPRSAYWCWGLEGERCRWYASVRLFRQETVGHWENCFAHAREALTTKLPDSR